MARTVSLSGGRLLGLAAAIFFGSFLFLTLKNAHYGPAALEARGELPKGTSVTVQWDTGDGINDQQAVVLQAQGGRVHFELPRVKISKVRLSSPPPGRIQGAELLSESGRSPQDLQQSPEGWIIDGLKGRAPVFSPLLLVLHLLMAFILSMIGLRVAGEWGRPLPWDRRVFLRLFAAASGCLLLWLLGQWPGIMTKDSLESWEIGYTLEFNNHHPWMYSMWVTALRQFWNSPAIVGLTQILATAGLGAGFFAFLEGQGVPRRRTIPFFVVFVTSVTVGLYTITVWKDIVFSILVLFWSMFTFYLGYRIKVGRPASLRWPDLLALAALLVFTCTVRHNGVVYLPFIPALLIWGRMIPFKQGLRMAAVAFALFALHQGIGRYVLEVDKYTDNHLQSLIWKFQPIMELFKADHYESDDYVMDRRVVEQLIPVETIKKLQDPTNILTVYPLLNLNLTDQMTQDLNGLYYSRIPRNPGLFLKNRMLCLNATLGLNKSSLYFTDNLRNHHLLDDPALFDLDSRPVLPWLGRVQYSFATWTKFTLVGRLLFWNGPVALLLLLWALVTYRQNPVTALACLIPVYQLPFLALTLMGSDFRMIYFLMLLAVFVPGMIGLERNTRPS